MEVFLVLSTFGALIYSGFSFMLTAILLSLALFFRNRCLWETPPDAHAPVEHDGTAKAVGEATPLVGGAASVKPRSDEDTRFYWIDNARYWLETCVIMKHTMVYVGTLYNWNTWWQPGLASFFESFMMPSCDGWAIC